jgi:hypothetical protein
MDFSGHKWLSSSTVIYAYDHPHRRGGLSWRPMLFYFGAAAAVLVLMSTGITRLKSLAPAGHTPTAAVTVQPVNLAPSQVPVSPAVIPDTPKPDKSAKLQDLLDQWQSSHPTQQWSAAVQGLSDPNLSAKLSADRKYDPASIYKLYLTYQLFQKYNLDSLDGASLQVDGRGSQSFKTCLDQIIKVSDNPCGEAMGYSLGWGKAETSLKQLGMNNTDINNSKGITTTAGDAALFLQKLYAGQLFDSATQQYLIGLMRSQIYRAGIPAGCSGCQVADKTGDASGVRHDAAIVQYDGGAYVLTIFTNGAGNGQIAQLTQQIQAIAAG